MLYPSPWLRDGPGDCSKMRKVLLCAVMMMGAVFAEMDEGNNIPPLVTAESIARAKQMFQGSPIQFQPVRPLQHQPRTARSAQGLSYQFAAPKHATMLAEPPSAFAGIPPWVFILTFFGSVGAIIIMFAVAERSELSPAQSLIRAPFDDEAFHETINSLASMNRS